MILWQDGVLIHTYPNIWVNNWRIFYTVKYLQSELSLLPLLFLKNDGNGSSFSNLYLLCPLSKPNLCPSAFTIFAGIHSVSTWLLEIFTVMGGDCRFGSRKKRIDSRWFFSSSVYSDGGHLRIWWRSYGIMRWFRGHGLCCAGCFWVQGWQQGTTPLCSLEPGNCFASAYKAGTMVGE